MRPFSIPALGVQAALGLVAATNCQTQRKEGWDGGDQGVAIKDQRGLNTVIAFPSFFPSFFFVCQQ